MQHMGGGGGGPLPLSAAGPQLGEWGVRWRPARCGGAVLGLPMHPQRPPPYSFLPHPWLLFRNLMDQKMLKSLLGDVFKAQGDRLVCLLCLLLLFVFVHFWAPSINFCALISTPATFIFNILINIRCVHINLANIIHECKNQFFFFLRMGYLEQPLAATGAPPPPAAVQAPAAQAEVCG